MDVGNESIHSQRDIGFISSMNKAIEKMYAIMRVSMPDIVATSNDSEMSFKNYDKYKRSLKTSVINKNYKDISKLLSKRFGINIVVEDKRKGLNNLISSILPPINYKVINMALNDLDILFPKKVKDPILWDNNASRSEKAMYGILNNIKSNLDKGNIELDLKNAYIKGLEGSTFIITVDTLRFRTLGITPEELTSVIIGEVGHIFSYLEYMTSTTNSNKILADTFLRERFTKGKDPVESFKIALEESNPDVKVDVSSPIKVMETLDAYILKTYRFGSSQRSIKIDFKRLADQFTARFGLGNNIANVLEKLNNLRVIRNSNDIVVDSWFYTFFRMTMYLTILVLSFLFFNIFGLVIFLTYITVKLLSYLIVMVGDFIKKVFLAIFSTDVDQTVNSESIIKRLTRIKSELIRQLRSEKMTDASKTILVEHIENIKSIIERMKDNFAILGKYAESNKASTYNKMEEVNFLTEVLQENELHFLKSKFELKG